MRSVIVTATDYEELTMIHTVRRLYQRPTGVTTQQKLDLARRFSVAHRLLKEKYDGKLPSDLLELQRKLEKYQSTLKEWGIYDYQVKMKTGRWGEWEMLTHPPYTHMHTHTHTRTHVYTNEHTHNTYTTYTHPPPPKKRCKIWRFRTQSCCTRSSTAPSSSSWHPFPR